MFASRLRASVFSILFPFVKWILFSKLLSEPACSPQSIYIEPVLKRLLWGIQRICGPLFLGFIHYACHEIFVNQHVLLHWNSTKLPCGMQRIWGPFVLKTIVVPFETLWACLHGGGGPQVLGVQIKMRDCMDRRPGYSNKASYLTYLGSPTPCKQALTHFLNLWYIPPHSCAFHSFCFTPIFSYVYYHAKYFSYPSRCCSSAKARNYIFIFNFSSQRPQLNYILLSKVYSFDTMEFPLKNKC